MRVRRIGTTVVALLFVVGAALTTGPQIFSQSAQPTPKQPLAPSRAEKQRIYASMAKLPLHFEVNTGQFGSDIDFIARGRGYTMALTNQGPVIALQGPVQKPRFDDAAPPLTTRTALGMELLGSNATAHGIGMDPLPGKINYYIGDQPNTWRTGIATFEKVRYARIYPGIDLIFYGTQQQVEYDFVVQAGADPTAIRFGLHGTTRTSIDARGDLILEADGRQVLMHKPIVYQQANGQRQYIKSEYVLQGEQVGFKVAAYDRSQPLVIDPVLTYSTFIGGNGEDGAWGLAVDSLGNIYVTGVTNSMTSDYNTSGQLGPYPTVNPPADGQNRFASCCGGNDTGRAFVTKLNPAGTALIYSTFIGGFSGTDGVVKECPLVPSPGCGGDAHFARGWDQGFGIAADTAGNAYITGQSESLFFPTTADALRPSHPGPNCGSTVPDAQGQLSCSSVFYGDHPRDAFFVKLGSGGNLLYSTLIGGHGSDTGQSVVVIDSGANQGIWLAGISQSVDFFGPNGALGNHVPAVQSYQTQLNTNPTHAAGQPAPASCTDAATGVNNWACWRDGYLIRLNPNLTVHFSTLFGGTGDDGAYGLRVDPATGNAYISGETESTDFPTTLGAFQQCHHSNGGYPSEPTLQFVGMAPFVCHRSPSPQTIDYPEQTMKPHVDAFVAKFGPEGTVLFSTYIGGSEDNNSGATGNDKAGDFGNPLDIDAAGNIYITGWTESTSHPKPVCGLTEDKPCPGNIPLPTTITGFQQDLAQDPTPACGPSAPPDCVPPNLRIHANSFLLKLNSTGTTLVYGTYIGGFGDDEGYAVAAVPGLPAGVVYVVGLTDSTNFPGVTAANHLVHPGCPTCGQFINGVMGPYDPDKPPQFADAFIIKIDTNSAGMNAIVYSTYLGGSADEVAHAVVYVNLGGFKGIYVAGLTNSENTRPPDPPPPGPGDDPIPPPPFPWFAFPTTPGAFQTVHAPSRTIDCPWPCSPIPALPNEDVFIVKISD